MKYLIILIIGLISFSQECISQDELSGREIWNKYLETFGDSNIVKNVKTYQTTSVATSDKGKVVSKLKIVFPDKVRMELKSPFGDKIIYVLNGDTGIVKTSGSINALPPDEIKRFKQMAQIFPELYFDKIELVGIKVIRDNEYYDILITTDINNMSYLIDKNNFQLFQMSTDSFNFEILDTMIIDGLKLVKTIKMQIGDEIMIVNYVDNKINKKIRNRAFKL